MIVKTNIDIIRNCEPVKLPRKNNNDYRSWKAVARKPIGILAGQCTVKEPEMWDGKILLIFDKESTAGDVRYSPQEFASMLAAGLLEIEEK